MLTVPGRRSFAPSAVDAFLRQTYEPRELLIVSDGLNEAARVTNDRRIRFVELPRYRHTIGQKRNVANTVAAGSIIAHWDDDDWSSPRRLASMACLLSAPYEVAGLRSMYFVNADDRDDVHLFSGKGETVNLGTSLVYNREFWTKNLFEDKDVAEDWGFVKRAARQHAYFLLEDRALMIARDHGGNMIDRRQYAGDDWTRASFTDLPATYRAALTGQILAAGSAR